MLLRILQQHRLVLSRNIEFSWWLSELEAPQFDVAFLEVDFDDVVVVFEGGGGGEVLVCGGEERPAEFIA